MRTQGRDHSHAEKLILVAPQICCAFCQANLRFAQRRGRYVQTLDKDLRLIMKDKKCSSTSCTQTQIRYRAAEEGRLVLKDHEFGLDIVVFAGEKHLRENLSIPRIHKLLRSDHRVPICERSVGDLIDDYVALCECVAGDTDRLRTRLAKQGAAVLSFDGVQYDDRSPVLYVARETLSGEVLYAERRLARAEDDLVPMLERTRDLVRDVGVPLVGVISDKERSLVPAIPRVFPNVPHQFCQTHFLKNVAEPLDEDNGRLEEAAREVVTQLRDVQRTIERQVRRAEEEAPRHAQDVTPAPVLTPAGGQAGASPAPAVAQSLDPSPAGLPARDAQGGRLSAPARAAAEQASPDLAIAESLACAGATVGRVTGRAILEPTGLKRVERLEQVRAAAQKAAQKKGVRRAAGL